MTSPVLKRVVRRETHSPRTAATVTVLVLVVAAALYAGTELVLHLLRIGPLLVAPGAALAWLTDAPSAEPTVLSVAGVIATILGLVLLWFALAPGRLARHQLDVSPHAVVVDNEVIAAALAEQLRRELDLSRGEVLVGVAHRMVDVTVVPRPGHEVETALVRSVAETELAGYQASPRWRVRARVARQRETKELP